MKLQNRTALITGGSGGIGGAISLELARQGARVAVHYHHDKLGVSAIIRQIQDLGRPAIAVTGDVSVASDVSRMFQDAVDALGDIDVFVAAAGIVGRGMIDTISDDDLESVVDVNVLGTFRCLREASRRMMRRRSGVIITVSSDAGKYGARGAGAHYAASKGATLAIAQTLARQLAPYGVRVNDVCPAEIATKMLMDRSEADRAAMAQQIPLRRLGLPSDVATLVAFLASDDASFITGVSIDVDGGLHLAR